MRFDLELAISAWRRTFEHRRGFFRDDVDELEGHLRDHVDWLKATGVTEEEAFRKAVREVGDGTTAEDEYGKVFWEKARYRGRILAESLLAMSMLRNYAKVSLRTLLRHKGYAFINVLGLAVGIACFLVIFLHVRHELSYDRFHEKAEQIYRVQMRYHEPYNQDWVPLYWGFGDLLQTQFSGEATVARIRRLFQPPVFRRGDRAFLEEGGLQADPTVFDVLTFPLVRGNPATALTTPDALVLTESMAQKYFGDLDPLGLTLEIGGETVEVTGVLQDVPTASHLQFDFLLPMTSVLTPWGLNENLRWRSHQNYTYIRVHQQSALPHMLEVLDRQAEEVHEADVTYFFLPLVDIHFGSHSQQEISPNSNRVYVYIFSAVALFLLLIACINFMNLATARGAERAREIGMRKTLGAYRRQLVGQFVGEALLLTALAMVLALMLVEVLVPVFNAVSGKSLAMAYFDPWWMPLMLGGIVLVVGLGAGAYPAFFLSAFDPQAVLKGHFSRGIGHARFRRVLVVVQFVISTFLIIGTLVMSRQLDFLQERSLGLDREQMLVIRLHGNVDQDDQPVLKEAFARIPGVRAVAGSSNIPGEQFGVRVVVPEGLPEGTPGMDFKTLFVDYDFLETYGIELAHGRNFSPEFGTDSTAVIVNEASARKLGWTDPIGKEIRDTNVAWDRRYSVVGVVRDFNYASLHIGIEPLLIRVGHFNQFLTLKLNAANLPSTLSQIEQAWQTVVQGQPLESRFLDDSFAKLYQSEQTLRQTFRAFAVLTIFVACLGLFGLAALLIHQRRKEVGIRKTLGASVAGIVMLFTRDFLKLVLVGSVVAAPLAYLAMERWLSTFAYRIDVSWWIFAAAVLGAMLVALAPIGYHSLRAAVADPVKALRYD